MFYYFYFKLNLNARKIKVCIHIMSDFIKRNLSSITTLIVGKVEHVHNQQIILYFSSYILF